MRLHSSIAIAFTAPGLFVSTTSFAQQPGAPALLPPTTVTATRVERESFDLPLSIDTVNARTIQEGRPQVNLSEALNAVPGIVVQNRHNYAQDLQISSRGFGARSTFGVRGLRLIADGIPATMPDGQGQAASFNLDTADRIEVLRGPFASMYGNASGGVIQIFTADGPPEPTLGLRAYRGSFDTSKWTLQYGAQHGALNVNASASRFNTDGYRDHSAARRDHAHGKFKLDGGSAGTFTVIADYLDQPETQDPLGLTAAQLAQNRRQAGANALAFNTRKSVSQNQLGLVHDLKIGARDSLQTRIYRGDRQVTQFLAIPLNVQAAPTHSGGVVDLDRHYSGAGVRWSHRTVALNGPLDVQVGFDYERMTEQRRGFINNLGVAGALKRDEDDTVDTADAYVQAEWRVHERVLLMAGVRYSRVRFDSQDFFIAAGNPSDSGSIRYVRTTPVGGITFDASPTLKLYVNAGKGFETPTFAELAYRPDGSAGLNFALRPSISRHREVGAKWLLGEHARVTAALFHIDVTDEIVVATSSGGRNTFRNAAKTRRKGAELAWQSRWAGGFETALAYTRLDAEFRQPFASGSPPVTVPAGNRLPGVPATTFYGEVVWRHAATGFHAAAEARYSDRLYVDDANSESAASYTIANLRAGFEQRTRQWRFTEFVRVDNITDKQYVGSVIVAEANRRFYEPSPGRNWLVGLSAELTFR
ncbi:MAG TPA: TonB-dependent receptor [Burkholderiales bacterium]|nr:TonB-dependent receptor [Burkholderiales bacterium]